MPERESVGAERPVVPRRPEQRAATQAPPRPQAPRSPAMLVGLQQAAGNRAVTSVVGSGSSTREQAPEVDLAVLAARPDLAVVGDRVRAAVAVERAELAGGADGLRGRITGSAEARVARANARAEGEVAGVTASVAAHRAEVAALVAAAAAGVVGATSDGAVQARGVGGASREDLRARVAASRARAVAAADEQARLAVSGGDAEAERAVSASGRAQERVSEAARQRIAAHQGDDKTRAAVRGAVTGACREVVGGMREQAGEVAGEVRESSGELAASLRKAGAALARDLGDGTDEVEGGLVDSTAAAVARIGELGSGQGGALEELRKQADSALDGLRAASVARIRAANAQVVEALRVGAARAAEGVDAAERAASTQLADGGATAVGALAGAPEGVAPEALDEFGRQVGDRLRASRVDAVERLTGSVDRVDAEQGALVSRFGDALDQERAQVDERAAQVEDSVAQAVQRADSATRQVVGTAVDGLRDEHGQVVGKHVAGLDEQVDSAARTWVGQREDTAAELAAEVDGKLREHDAVAAKSPGEFGKVAEQADEEANASLLSRIGSGVWSAVTKFAEGLLVLLAVAAVVFVVLVALKLVALSVAGALVALAVAGVLLLVYSLITGFIDRWRAYRATWGDQPWYVDVGAALGVLVLSVGGAVGLTQLVEGAAGVDLVTWKGLGVEERSERVTEGVLIIATILLLRGLSKRGGGVAEGPAAEPPRGGAPRTAEPPGEAPPVEVPRSSAPEPSRTPEVPERPVEPVPAPVVDPYAALGVRFGLSPDVVAVLRDAGSDVVVAERLLSRGVDPERVALASAYRGPTGLALLDVLTEAGIPEGAAWQFVDGAVPMGRAGEVEAFARSGALERLLDAGLDAERIVLLVDDLGARGVEVVDALVRGGVQAKVAVDVANLARAVGAADEVHRLTTSGNLENPASLRAFLQDIRAELANRPPARGKLTTLQDIADRSTRGRVALEWSTEARTADGRRSGADIIDHGTREAVQQKVVTGKGAQAVVDNLAKACAQLTGKTGEHPPAGYLRVADVRITTEVNPLFPLERATLLDALRENGVDARMVVGADQVRVGNGTGTHVFQANEF
ncbi:hypothetical protein [Actinosynnema pretiosum]|uniref:Uncharacterized protein n=1 Tax=Actinosynnema pretiosum TaxID=42197 RepID=A0A290Z6X0_9PSEU|nr:hypothetical protein [Actinosynnema pretiosum]ATE54770.1 hypothetical protein CNX65_17025 [Actinosynnema pretiosum]